MNYRSNEKKPNYVISVIIFFCSVCCAMKFFVSFKYEPGVFKSAFAEICACMKECLQGKSLLATVLTVLFFEVGKRRYDRNLPTKSFFLVLSVFIAFVWLFGENLNGGSFNNVVKTPGQVTKAFIFIIGSSFFIFEMISLLNHFFDSANSKPLLNGFFRERNCLLPTAVCLLLLWAVQIAISYPANICYDSWNQILQFWGYVPVNANHPPVYTLLIGAFMKLGEITGSVTTGLFFFVICQAIAYALVIGYAVELMNKLSAHRIIVILFVVTAGVSPYYANRVNLVLKDGLFSIGYLLFFTEAIYALVDLNSFSQKWYHWFLTFFAIMSVMLLRNNGKYAMLPAICAAVISLEKNRKKYCKKNVRTVLLVLIMPVVVSISISALLKLNYVEKQGSIAEGLSLPFQQTARTVLEHANDITEEEKLIIDSVLVYEVLADRYDARISDPVKETFRAGAKSADIAEYLALWIKMFFKYPGTYLEAIVSQNFYLVDPFVENNVVYMSYYASNRNSDMVKKLREDTGLKDINDFTAAKEALEEYNDLLFSFPIVGVLSHPAVYVMVLLVVVALSLKKKYKNLLLVSFPSMIFFIMCILSPVIQGHPRYVFPIIYTTPLLVSYYMYVNQSSGNR